MAQAFVILSTSRACSTLVGKCHRSPPLKPNTPHLVLDGLQHEALVLVQLAHPQRRQRLQRQSTRQHCPRGLPGIQRHLPRVHRA